MTKYQKFLNRCNVITENEFDEIIKSLPDVNISSIDFSGIDYLDSKNEICDCIINSILEKYNFVYVTDVDFENKTFIIEDAETVEDLEEISLIFDKWTITNLEELKNSILESLQDNYFKKLNIIRPLIEKLSIEEIKKIVEGYEN